MDEAALPLPAVPWRTATALLDGLADRSNASVWLAFVERHQPLMVGYFRKVGLSLDEAEEVAQLTLGEFAAAYARGAYDRRKGRLIDWLFGIARNQLANLRRSEARARRGIEHGHVEGCLDDPNEAVWLDEWRQHMLRLCFEQLAEEVSLESLEAFRLFCIQGMPAAEVALSLNMTENAVYLNKRRMLRRIRELLDQLEQESSHRGPENPA